MELIFSIVALAAGPLLFPVVKRRPQFLCGMDGFVFVSIAGLSLFHMLPEAVEHAGWWALLSALAGILGPFIFGQNLHHSGQRTVHNIFIIIAALGLAIHAMIDGAAIFHGTHGLDAHLGEDPIQFGGMVAAVLIHRVPMSLLIWWSLKPKMGTGVASGALGILGVATAVGYAVSGMVEMTPPIMGHLVAFVAGSLVHVVGHDTASELIPKYCQDKWHATYSAIGGTIAALGLFYFGHFHDLEPTWERFSSLFIKASPALLIGFTLGGLMEAGFGRAMMSRLRGKSRLGSAFRGVIFGTPIPICSCGVETVYESMTRRALPVAATVAFLLAAPAMTLDSMALSVKLLGVELTAIRFIFSALVAVAVAFIASNFIRPDPKTAPPAEHDPEVDAPLKTSQLSLGSRAKESLKLGWVEQIDHVAPWVIVGFAITALVWPTLLAGAFEQLWAGFDIAALTLLAAPFYLNASGMTALASALLAGGVSVGAIMAMLVASPALNITALALVKKLHGPRAMCLILATSLALPLGLGLLSNQLISADFQPLAQAVAADILQVNPTTLELISSALLAALFLLSFFRMGPRGMMLQLLPADHHHMHAHEHDHGQSDHAH